MPAVTKKKKRKLETQKVQTFGKKKHAIAIVTCQKGKGLIKCNGVPIHLIVPEAFRLKVQEPVLVAGKDKFRDIDIRAIAKSLVAYYQKCGPSFALYAKLDVADVDETRKLAIKDAFLRYDRGLLVADPRRTEPKKFGGHGARARRTKSYR